MNFGLLFFLRACTPILFIVLCLTACQRDHKSNKTLLTISSNTDTLIAGFKFVKVKAGPYLHGPENKIERITYDYLIMKYEVTNLQYYNYLVQQLSDKKVWVQNGRVFKKILGISGLTDSVYSIKVLNSAIGFANDSFYINPNFANHPVIAINWIGCADFCQTNRLLLPTPGEWEKAARGVTGFQYPWGNDIDKRYANYRNSNDPFEPGTTPVGYFNGQTHNGFETKDASSPYGCYDMAGNAWEYLDNYLTDPGMGGAGGGFNYHTAAFVCVYNINCFGIGIGEKNIERCDTADGFRAVIR